MHVRAFGGLTLYRHTTPVMISWESQKARRLFCYLMIACDQWVHRDRLMALLWPAFDYDRRKRNFMTTLTRLRTSLQMFRQLNPILSRGDAYQLNFETVTCDYCIFRKEAAAGIRHMIHDDPGHAKAHLQTAVELYTAEFLPEEPADQVIVTAKAQVSELFDTAVGYLEKIYLAEGRADLLPSLRCPSRFAAYMPDRGQDEETRGS